MYPYPNPSILAKGVSLLKNIKWGSFLDGAGKTLGVINQAIPVVYQVKPIISNAKTLFKVANAMNTKETNTNTNTNTNTPIDNHNSPIFYL